jgi:hypothetical protein
VLMLQDQRTDPTVAAALGDAAAWLATQQGPDGSFGNANSTGIAGWALGVSGNTAAATAAARWVRAHQLANAGVCATYAAQNAGAITLDDLGLANAASGPFDAVDNSVATRATTQALPTLLWAPGGTNAGAFTLTGPTGFQAAGSTQQYSIQGAPGDTVCVTSVGAPTKVVLGATGTGTVMVNLPASTTSVSVSAVDAVGETHALSVTGLAKAQLNVKLKKDTVAKGKKAVVKVRGLAPGETVTVKLGKKRKQAVANANGKAKVKVKVTKIGKAKVKAIGEFKNRRGKATLTVVP